MKKISTLLLVALLAIVGCDTVVSTEAVGASYKETKRTSCSHASFCFTCMPGFDGKLSCGLKFSPMCPGEQTVEVEVTPVAYHYQSGKVEHLSQEKITKFLSDCE